MIFPCCAVNESGIAVVDIMCVNDGALSAYDFLKCGDSNCRIFDFWMTNNFVTQSNVNGATNGWETGDFVETRNIGYISNVMSIQNTRSLSFIVFKAISGNRFDYIEW